MDYSKLVTEAFEARKRSYAPYSNFMVGAALLTEDGKLYHGCNIESAALTPGTCAERTALFTAVYEGERRFAALAVVGGNRETTEFSLCFPCGVCRQALNEFCSLEMPVIVARSPEDYEVHTLGELLPFSFGGADLAH